METQLQDIIAKIHDEGVKGAEERAHAITEQAEKQAQEQISKARSEAERIVKEAKQEAARLQSAGEAALQQAGRDLLLSVQKKLNSLFETVMKDAAAEALSPEKMAGIIAALVEKWYEAEEDDLTVLVPEKDRDALEKTLRSRLGKKMQEGVSVKPVRSMATGFRIATGDGSSYYDVTEGTLTDLLSAYLNPRLTAIMRDAGE
ncbi:MAG: V-type ATP synthase subunit E [Spirochaetaceae bacterium]|nr:MAG: V-type ATP synthase subunit E [Spirochaetaceae bacterium]